MATLKSSTITLCLILLFTFDPWNGAKAATRIYKFHPEENKYAQDLVAVSSTVIPLKTIEVTRSGIGHLSQTSYATKLHKKLQTASKNKANATLSNVYTPADTLITSKAQLSNRLPL